MKVKKMLLCKFLLSVCVYQKNPISSEPTFALRERPTLLEGPPLEPFWSVDQPLPTPNSPHPLARQDPLPSVAGGALGFPPSFPTSGVKANSRGISY